MLDSQALQALPSPGRAAFLIGTTVPTVIPSGDAQFNRQQDQTNASLLSLGGGTRRGNNYTLDGVPITDLTQPRGRQPDDRVARGRQGAGAHLRRGDGPDRRRRVQHDAQVGHEQLPRHRVLPDAAGMGRGEQLLQPEGARGLRGGRHATASTLNKKQDTAWYVPGVGFGGPIEKDRTVLLVRHARTTTTSRRATRPGIVLPTAAERSGDFSADDDHGAAPVMIYDPLTHLPFPGNIIPADRISPIAAKMLSYVPLPHGQRRRRRVELQLGRRMHQRPVPAVIQRQGRAQVHATRCR